MFSSRSVFGDFGLVISRIGILWIVLFLVSPFLRCLSCAPGSVGPPAGPPAAPGLRSGPSGVAPARQRALRAVTAAAGGTIIRGLGFMHYAGSRFTGTLQCDDARTTFENNTGMLIMYASYFALFLQFFLKRYVIGVKVVDTKKKTV